MNWNRRPLALLLLATLAVAGCGDSETGPLYYDAGPGSDAYRRDTVPNDGFLLTIVGSNNLTLAQGQQVSLKLRYTKNSVGQASEVISLSFRGNAQDSRLANLTLVTDAHGYAQTVLTAGQIATSFQIEAQAYGALSATWYIQVRQQVQPTNAKFTGTFVLTSNFNIMTDFTGSNLADVLNVLAVLGSEGGVGKWAVDTIINSLDESQQNLVNWARPSLYEVVNSLIMSMAPDLVRQVQELSRTLSSMARQFAITSHMISASEQANDRPVLVTHRLNSIAWTYQGQKAEYTFAGAGLTPPEVENLSLSIENGIQLNIPEHAFSLPYGIFLLNGLNSLVIPMINGAASSFEDLLAGWINCQSVGKSINDTVGMFGEPFWQGACDTALGAAGQILEDQVKSLGQDTSSLLIYGQSHISDMNNDQYYDTMANGTWSGSFDLNANTAVIDPQTNTFTGIRIQ